MFITTINGKYFQQNVSFCLFFSSSLSVDLSSEKEKKQKESSHIPIWALLEINNLFSHPSRPSAFFSISANNCWGCMTQPLPINREQNIIYKHLQKPTTKNSARKCVCKKLCPQSYACPTRLSLYNNAMSEKRLIWPSLHVYSNKQVIFNLDLNCLPNIIGLAQAVLQIFCS